MQNFSLLCSALFGAAVASLGIRLTLGDDKGGLTLIGMSLGSSIGGAVAITYANHLQLQRCRAEKQRESFGGRPILV